MHGTRTRVTAHLMYQPLGYVHGPDKEAQGLCCGDEAAERAAWVVRNKVL